MKAKICVFGDVHLGCRLNSELFLDNRERFFRDVFFPSIEEQKPDALICLGDVFDTPLSVNTRTLDRSVDFFFRPLADLGIPCHILVGNHDSYFGDSNELSMVGTVVDKFFEGSKLKVITKPCRAAGQLVLMPWVCKATATKTKDMLAELTSDDIVFGHFDVVGFRMNAGYVNQDKGFKISDFEEAGLVLSGHYHNRSKIGNVRYIGATNQITWADYGEDFGFCYLTVGKGKKPKIEYVDNNDDIFEMIIYGGEDDAWEDLEEVEIEGKHVRVVVESKDDHKDFVKFRKALEERKPAKIDVIDKEVLVASDAVEENWAEKDVWELIESKIKDSDAPKKKPLLKLFAELYEEAQGML